MASPRWGGLCKRLLQFCHFSWCSGLMKGHRGRLVGGLVVKTQHKDFHGLMITTGWDKQLHGPLHWYPYRPDWTARWTLRLSAEWYAFICPNDGFVDYWVQAGCECLHIWYLLLSVEYGDARLKHHGRIRLRDCDHTFKTVHLCSALCLSVMCLLLHGSGMNISVIADAFASPQHEPHCISLITPAASYLPQWV